APPALYPRQRNQRAGGNRDDLPPGANPGIAPVRLRAHRSCFRRYLANQIVHNGFGLPAAPETKPGATYWAPFNLITRAALPTASAARGEGVTQHGDSNQSERSLNH